MDDSRGSVLRPAVWSTVLAVAFLVLGVALLVGIALPARHEDVLVACGTSLLAVTSVVLAGAFAATTALLRAAGRR